MGNNIRKRQESPLATSYCLWKKNPITSKEKSRGCSGRSIQIISDYTNACSCNLKKACRKARAIFTNEEFRAGAGFGLIIGFIVAAALFAGLTAAGWPLVVVVTAIALSILFTVTAFAVYKYMQEKQKMENELIKNEELIEEIYTNKTFSIQTKETNSTALNEENTRDREGVCSQLIVYRGLSSSINCTNFSEKDINLSKEFLNINPKSDLFIEISKLASENYQKANTDKSILLAIRYLIKEISPLDEWAARIPLALNNRKEMEVLKKAIMCVPLLANWISKLQELETKFDSREAVLFAAPYLMNDTTKEKHQITNGMLEELLTELIHDHAQKKLIIFYK